MKKKNCEIKKKKVLLKGRGGFGGGGGGGSSWVRFASHRRSIDLSMGRCSAPLRSPATLQLVQLAGKITFWCKSCPYFFNTYEEKLLTTDSASTDRNLLPAGITCSTVVNPRLCCKACDDTQNTRHRRSTLLRLSKLTSLLNLEV